MSDIRQLHRLCVSVTGSPFIYLYYVKFTNDMLCCLCWTL